MNTIILVFTLLVILSLLLSILVTYGKIWIDKMSGKAIKSTPVPYKNYQRDF